MCVTVMAEKVAMDGYVRDKWPDTPVISSEISLRVSIELFDKLKKEAKKKNFPLAGLLAEIIVKYYKKK